MEIADQNIARLFCYYEKPVQSYLFPSNRRSSSYRTPRESHLTSWSFTQKLRQIEGTMLWWNLFRIQFSIHIAVAFPFFTAGFFNNPPLRTRNASNFSKMKLKHFSPSSDITYLPCLKDRRYFHDKRGWSYNFFENFTRDLMKENGYFDDVR